MAQREKWEYFSENEENVLSWRLVDDDGEEKSMAKECGDNWNI